MQEISSPSACFDITLEDDASSVYDKVSRLHYDIMREHFPLLVQGIAPRLPQDQNKSNSLAEENPRRWCYQLEQTR